MWLFITTCINSWYACNPLYHRQFVPQEILGHSPWEDQLVQSNLQTYEYRPTPMLRESCGKVMPLAATFWRLLKWSPAQILIKFQPIRKTKTDAEHKADNTRAKDRLFQTKPSNDVIVKTRHDCISQIVSLLENLISLSFAFLLLLCLHWNKQPVGLVYFSAPSTGGQAP